MILKNLTSTLKEFEVRDITSSQIFKCYLQPHGTVEIERMILVNPDALEGIEIVGQIIRAPRTPVVEELTISEDTPSDVAPSEEGETKDPEEPTPSMNEDKFICDECGAEFASAKGLTAHKSRSHNK